MGEKFYRIVFKGELAYGFQLEETRTNLKQLCGYDDVTLDRLFSGEPSTLKNNLSHEMVEKPKAALDQTGAVSIIEEMAAAANRPSAATERKKEGVAWATNFLTLLNVLIFYCFELHVDPDIIFDHLVFSP